MTDLGREYQYADPSLRPDTDYVPLDDIDRVDTSDAYEPDTADSDVVITTDRYDGAYDVEDTDGSGHDLASVRASALAPGAEGDIRDDQAPEYSDVSDVSGVDASDVVAAAEEITDQSSERAEAPPVGDTSTGEEPGDTDTQPGSEFSTDGTEASGDTPGTDTDSDATQIDDEAEPEESDTKGPGRVYRSTWSARTLREALLEAWEEDSGAEKTRLADVAKGVVRGIAAVIESSRLTEEEKAEVRDRLSAAEQSAMLPRPDEPNLLKDTTTSTAAPETAKATDTSVKDTSQDAAKDDPDVPTATEEPSEVATTDEPDASTASPVEAAPPDAETVTLSDPRPDTGDSATQPPVTNEGPDGETDATDDGIGPRVVIEELVEKTAEPTDFQPQPHADTPGVPRVPDVPPPSTAGGTPDGQSSFVPDPEMSGTPPEDRTDMRPGTADYTTTFDPHGPVDPTAPVVEGEFVDATGRPVTESGEPYSSNPDTAAQAIRARERATTIGERALTDGARIAAERGYEPSESAVTDSAESTPGTSTPSSSATATSTDPTSAAAPAPSPTGPEGPAPAPNTSPAGADPNATPAGSDPNAAPATASTDPNAAPAPTPNADPSGGTAGPAPNNDPTANPAPTASGTTTAPGPTGPRQPGNSRDRAGTARDQNKGQQTGSQAPRYQAAQPSRTHDARARARRRADRRAATIRIAGDAARFGGRVVAGIAGEVTKGAKDSAKGLIKKVKVENVTEQRSVGLAKLLRRAGILRRNLTVRVVNRAGQSAQITVKARGMNQATAAARAKAMATKRRHFITRTRIAAKLPGIR